VFAFTFSCLLVAIFYFGFSLPITETIFVPQIAYMPLAVLMVFRRPDFRLVLIAGFVSFCLLGWVILLSSSGADVVRQTLSGGQFVYTIILTAILATARPFEPKNAAKIAHYCQGFSVFFVILGILEILTPLRILSDFFREAVYGSLAYSSDIRDMGIAGFVRPKAFSAEPSHAAWGIAMLIITSIGFRPDRINFLIVFYSPNAPIAAVFLLFTAVILFWDRRKIANTLITTSVVVLVAGSLFFFILSNMLGSRMGSFIGYEESFYIRVIQPVLLAKIALSYNWVVGVGYGGLEAIWTEISVIDGGATVENLNRTPGMALFTIPLYTGVTGSILFLALVIWVFRRYGPRMGSVIAGLLIFTLLQKQSFVISSAWIVAAIWAMQMPASATAVKIESQATKAREARLR
jgi:hypothetical protein